MFCALLQLLAASVAVRAQSVINSRPAPPPAQVIQLTDADTYILEQNQFMQPVVVVCPPGKKCDILCTASPPPSLANYNGGIFGGGLLGACENITIVAGLTTEVKVICEDWACNFANMQLSGELVIVECIGPNACSGANIQCGAQAPNQYVANVPPTAQFDRCHVTCSNGGCAGESPQFPGHRAVAAPGRPLRKGASIRCVGRMTECRVKANSQVSGFTYGPNMKSHIGSYTGGEFICETAPGGVCAIECSDTPGVHYCNGLNYKCRALKAQCTCTDFCQQNPGSCPRNKPGMRDCRSLRMPTPQPTAAPTTATGSPTSAPTHAPTTSPSNAPTSSPTLSPTASPTTAPTSRPTRPPTFK